MKAGRLILSVIIAVCCIFGAVGCSGGEKSSVGNTEPMTFVDGDKIAEITIEGYGTIYAKLFPDLCPEAVENFIMLAENGYYDGLKIHRVAHQNDLDVIQGGSLLGDGTGEKALINEEGEFGLETDVRARHFYGALCYANDNGKNATQFYIVTNKESQDISKYDPEKIKVAAAAYSELKAAAEEGSPEYDANAYLEQWYNNLYTMLTDDSTDAAFIYKQLGGNPLYDGSATVFGQVYDGFDVIDAISEAKVQTNAYGEASKPVEDIVIASVKIIEYKAPTTAEATDEEDDDDEDEDDEDEETAETDETGSDEAGTAESSDTVEIHIETLETEE